MAILNFDATAVDPQEERDFSPIPQGDYTAAIVASEMKDTKDFTGQYLELRVQILEGQYKGRLIFSRLNLQNKNPKAVEIARQELSAICRAVGVLRPQDSSDLHDRPMKIGVKIRPGKDKDKDNKVAYGPSNEIKSWKPAGDPAPAQAPAAPAKKPWEN